MNDNNENCGDGKFDSNDTATNTTTAHNNIATTKTQNNN